MKGTATVVRVDGTEQVLDHRPTLKEAQDVVGGCIELIKVGHGRTLVVDAEGKVKGKRTNQKITTCFARAAYGSCIVGDVIVLESWKTVGKDT